MAEQSTDGRASTLAGGVRVTQDNASGMTLLPLEYPPDRDEQSPVVIHRDMVRLTLDRLKHMTDRKAVPAEPVEPTTVADTLLHDACREGASDIHLDPRREGAMVRFRINGLLYDVAELLPEQAQRLVNQIKTESNIDPVHAFHPVEGRWRHELEGRHLDMRVTCVPSISGEKLTIRVLDPKRIGHQLHHLGFCDEHRDLVQQWTENADGLFLTVGPTGGGKTTTLYALLHRFRDGAHSVVTIEDPVEYRLDGLTQVQVDMRHDLTFATGIRSMLRLDPDYVMIGEVRDAASAEAAVNAAITGRVVMSSIHCSDAASSVTALRNWGLNDHQIAASLRVVVAQRLVRTLNPETRVECEPDESDRRWLAAVKREAPQQCFKRDPEANRAGLDGAGRTGVFEVLRMEDNDLEMILGGAGQRQLRRSLAEREHRTLVDDGLEKVQRGQISLADLRQAVGTPMFSA